MTAAALANPAGLRRPVLTWGATDWIEKLLGLGMHRADRVLPEFLDPTIGYVSNRMRIELIEPRRGLAWRSENCN